MIIRQGLTDPNKTLCIYDYYREGVGYFKNVGTMISGDRREEAQDKEKDNASQRGLFRAHLH